MVKKMKNEKINIGRLIERIGPLNNKIRKTNGYRKLSLMWDIGDILFKAGVKRIHPVAWEIQNKSYITRDLLSYCYRIRRKWPDKSQLRRLFGNLKSYPAFREALPLIENEKFILSEKKVSEMIKWLNEDDPKDAKMKILRLKKEYTNIRNDRSRRLAEVKKEAEVFKEFSHYLIRIIKEGDEKEITKIRNLGDETLLKLSQICMSISNDNYKGPSAIKKTSNKMFDLFTEKMLPISLSKKEVKARFRRVVPPEYIIEVADILNSLRNKEPVNQIKKRLGWSI